MDIVFRAASIRRLLVVLMVILAMVLLLGFSPTQALSVQDDQKDTLSTASKQTNTRADSADSSNKQAGMQVGKNEPKDATSVEKKSVSSSDAKDKQSEKSVSEEAFLWNPESDCGVCHKEIHSFDDMDVVASKHPGLKQNCVQCHNDSKAMEMAHKKAKYGKEVKVKRLKRTEVEKDQCLSCHDVDALPEATVQDANGLTVQVHNLPDITEHENIQCADCHSVHVAVEEDFAQKFCLSCHHENVYECHTCHS